MEKYDFVSRYVSLLSKITDAPKEFQEAATLFLLSVAVGLVWVFRSLPETSIFRHRTKDTDGKILNLWFILIGKSRITRKTFGVIKHVTDLAKDVLKKEHMLTEAFTPESLIEQMAKMSVRSVAGKQVTVCSWISDEIAWFFQHLKKKNSYMATADAFLSKMYDGSTYSRGTIGRGKKIVWNPYLTCFLASTDYLPALFDKLQVRLGFMNRFIYVVGERKQRKPLRTESLTEEEEKKAREIKEFLRALAQKTSVTTLGMSDEARQLYDSFEEKIENRIENEDLGIKEGYCGQLPNLAVRFSCLYRISRMATEEIRTYNDPLLIVEKQDVERAIEYVMKVWNWFENVTEIMETKDEKKRRMLQRNQVKELVLRFLEGGKVKQRKEIVAHINEQMKVGGATISNALDDLRVLERKICQPKYGFYMLRVDCKTCKLRNSCTSSTKDPALRHWR